MATRYMFLIYSDESAMTDVTPDQWEQMLQAHNAWAASVVEAGATIHGGDALAPTSVATTVRTRLVDAGRRRLAKRRDRDSAAGRRRCT